MVLWTAGSEQAIARDPSRRVAIVGARAATSYGEHVASELASELAEGGVNIISGGAYGIHGAAHRGAIASQPGSTVAILAGRLDRPYPAGNAHLFHQITPTPPTEGSSVERGQVVLRECVRDPTFGRRGSARRSVPSDE